MSGDLDEEFIAEEEAENPALVVKRLRERLTKAEAERAEYLEGWQRSKADFINLKRDEETRRSHAQERILASLIEELIPVLDSFEMAAKHSASKELEVLQKQFLDVVKRMGIESFGKKGDAFDPQRHEAVQETVVDSPALDHTIVTVERSGYSVHGHIIRPAQVTVGTFTK